MFLARRAVLSFLGVLMAPARAVLALQPGGSMLIGGEVRSRAGPVNVGYSAVITLFGSATYNTNGTITGTPNGSVYTFNPDSPDSHTAVTDLGDFVSDFANFTQGCVHCTRTDTALRVYFRKDKAGANIGRIEIILELGHFTTDGSAANLGPFSLQILQAGIPRNIAVFTRAGAGSTWVPGGATFTGFTNVTTAYFPGMGWWSRWRWNPTPRAVIRTGSQLLPANLNLLPNFNQTLGTTYGATVGGACPRLDAYSSAGLRAVYSLTGSNPTNYNPVGVNECLSLATAIGGTGDRPELGLCHEAACDWVCNAGSQQQTEMFVYAEADGGVPWHLRDSSDGWAPHDFNANPNYGWYWGHGNGFASPYTSIDCPGVPVPSAGNGSGISPTGWTPDLYHTANLSFIPYLVTGDPFYLENIQDKLTWLIGSNFYARQVGNNINPPDANNTVSSPAFAQAIVMNEAQSRGLAWCCRDLATCIICTPNSVPSWLRPRSYWTGISTLNQQYIDTQRARLVSGSGLPQTYPSFTDLGLVFATMEGYGLYMSYMGMGMGLLCDQATQTNWAPFAGYTGTAPIEMATGSTGYDNRATHQYGYWTAPGSTDYGVPVSNFANYGDSYNFGLNSAMVEANTQYQNAWSINIDSSGCGPTMPVWQASHGYHCNNWIVEVRAGVPVVPNAGDTISITISGSFSGSPRTFNHTITSGDVTNLINSFINNGTSPGSNPLSETWLMAAINGDSTLSAAGITASTSNANWDGQANTGGSWQFFTSNGRIYISFNSDGSSSLGGPVIGPITVSGTFTTGTNCSLYIQPNGDGVHNGTSSSAVLYHRALSYQCAQSGTSAGSGGPTGTALQTPTIADNTCKWCYVPEFKSSPIYTPGGPTQANYPGWGGVYGSLAGNNPSYMFWTMAGLVGLNNASIANSLTGRTAVKALLDSYKTAQGGTLTGSDAQRWGFAIEQ